jgi:3',5'-cyclic AMP phosphodiesterase CpdA
MSRLIHLSDLHFGKDRPDLLAPLIACVNELNPDLIAISGDFTQRARDGQFEEAHDFIQQLEAPVLAVPGNHDVSLHRPFKRFFMPWRSYKKWIDTNLTPTFENDDMIVVGINSVDRFSWQTGRLTSGRINHACAAMNDAEDGKARVLVVHHPLEHPAGTKKKPIPGADQALDRLLGCGANLILSGHLHTWHADNFTVKSGTTTAVQLHAGTSLSSRVRGEPNDFNVIDISGNHIDVSRLSFNEDARVFETTEARQFNRASDTLIE